jgi:integrase
MQRGQIFKKGRSWFLRYREPILENGEIVQLQVCKRLAPFDKKYKSKRAVAPLALKFLAPVNAGTLHAESTQLVKDFIESVYFPRAKEKRRPSTYKGYKDIFKYHLNGRLGDIRMRDFRTVIGERLLADIAAESELSHESLRRVKSFLSGVFKFAKQQGVIDGENPMRDTTVPPGSGSAKKDTHAYSLEEIQTMLRTLPEPARTVVLTAALTGLRVSEIRGLSWEAFTGDELRVAQTVWRTHVQENAKTPASKASVPVLPVLRKALQNHRKRSVQNGFVFAGEKKGFALNLHNLGKRVIKPGLEGSGVEWKGWHSFRRGLGTNLYRLGVPDKVIQAILRHANVSTTLAFYVKPPAADSVAAMKKLQEALSLVKNVQQNVQRGRRKI